MRKAIIIATAVVFGISALGCMSLSFGERTEVVTPKSPVPVSDDGPVTWNGSQLLAPGEEATIYYPMPFQSPPNLVIADASGSPSPTNYYLIEQKADCFRVRNATGAPCRIPWTARDEAGTAGERSTSTGRTAGLGERQSHFAAPIHALNHPQAAG